MCSKDVFGDPPVSIRAPCCTIDEPHVDPTGAPSAPKDDAMACMASSLNTPLVYTIIGMQVYMLSSRSRTVAVPKLGILEIISLQLTSAVADPVSPT